MRVAVITVASLLFSFHEKNHNTIWLFSKLCGASHFHFYKYKSANRYSSRRYRVATAALYFDFGFLYRYSTSRVAWPKCDSIFVSIDLDYGFIARSLTSPFRRMLAINPFNKFDETFMSIFGIDRISYAFSAWSENLNRFIEMYPFCFSALNKGGPTHRPVSARRVDRHTGTYAFMQLFVCARAREKGTQTFFFSEQKITIYEQRKRKR